MTAFGKELLFRSEAGNTAVADHLDIAAEIARSPDNVLCGAFAHEANLNVPILVRLLHGVEDVDQVLVQRVLHVVGEAGELHLDGSEALQRDGAVLLAVDFRIGPHGPVLKEGDERAAGVNDNGLELFHVGGLKIGKNLFIGVAEDRRFPVLGFHTAHASVEIDQDRVRG